MSLVTIHKVSDMSVAQLMRMKLESAGVPVHLHSGEFASLFGGAGLFGAIRIQVPADFESQARALLEELREDMEDGK